MSAELARKFMNQFLSEEMAESCPARIDLRGNTVLCTFFEVLNLAAFGRNV
jgi:hypothetical protein